MANVHMIRILKDSAGVALDSVAKTATFSSETLKPGDASHIGLFLDVNTVSGTSPTLNVKAQISFDGGTTWLDSYPAALNSPTQWAFTQITAAIETAEIVQNWAAPQASSSINPVVKFVFTIAGTNPSFTSDIWVAFYQDRPF